MSRNELVEWVNWPTNQISPNNIADTIKYVSHVVIDDMGT
jgi:hypothetical protein